ATGACRWRRRTVRTSWRSRVAGYRSTKGWWNATSSSRTGSMVRWRGSGATTGESTALGGTLVNSGLGRDLCPASRRTVKDWCGMIVTESRKTNHQAAAAAADVTLKCLEEKWTSSKRVNH